MQVRAAYGAQVHTPLAELAARQHGVVAARQLAALGLSRSMIRRMRERGWLFLIHRGVYAVGHPWLTLHGRWMAAVLACGADAALSHHQAAALHGCAGRRGPRSTSPPRSNASTPTLSAMSPGGCAGVRA
jgi:predicted transcriptional regulator of viral defense system